MIYRYAALAFVLALVGCGGPALSLAATPGPPHAPAVRSGPAGHVLGIGGVFFKSDHDEAQRDWYGRHMGMVTTAMQGTSFAWLLPGQTAPLMSTRWYVFPSSADYFNGPCMVSYVVDDRDAMVKRLQQDGVKVDPPMDSPEEGKFAWAYDGDGNRIELWEPLPPAQLDPHEHVLGIGGVFLKSPNPKAGYAWYSRHLGIAAEAWGANFFWDRPGTPPTKGSTTWSLFPTATKRFNGPCMINYIIEDLAATQQRLKAEGVEVDPKVEEYEGNKFGWAFDGDQHKIELWQPARAKAAGTKP